MRTKDKLLIYCVLLGMIFLFAGCKSSTDPNRVANPVFSPEPGNYEDSQLVSISCSTPGAEIRYTLDGSVPPTNSLIYNAPFLVESGTILKAFASKPGLESSSVVTGIYGTNVKTPVISPQGGNYQLAPSVKITCLTPGAEIRYTLDGSEPDENAVLYICPLLISNNATLKAKAFKANCTPSQTATEVYSVQLSISSAYDTPGSARGVALKGDYAYVADWEAGLQIINLGNPKSPILVGSCDTPGQAYKVAVQGNYAYVADYDAGLQVVDISDPSAPFIAGTLATSAECRGVALNSDYLYTNIPFQSVNISDPSHPQTMGICEVAGYAEGIALAGNYAYVAAWYGGLKIIDISDPFSPIVVGSAAPVYYSWDVDVWGSYALVADSDAGIFVFNVSNPANPVPVTSLAMQSSTQGICVSGNYAYVADGGWGLKVLKLYASGIPEKVGFCDTPGWAYEVAVSGNTICVADGAAGLQVIRLR